MGWTRGRDREHPGKFAYELWDDDGMVEHVGGFETAQEADRAAEAAQRILLFGMPPEIDEYEAMTDEELLRELGADIGE